ncbi:hypothetical protein [Lacticaseibacillus hegangensis]|uniref:hypothetical protein n=1 Tax=Lacticaseibacillus hegangensis TaxID=2486010 RepID=UPI0013DD8E68|nr:hypothetical protein [Lacticaseibacillus hegangensis]
MIIPPYLNPAQKQTFVACLHLAAAKKIRLMLPVMIKYHLGNGGEKHDEMAKNVRQGA